MALWESLLAVIVVSLIAVLAAIPFLLKKNIPHMLLMILLSISAGTLLGAVFLHFLPEAISEGYTLGVVFIVMLGFLVMFIVEKWVHHHHNSCKEHKHLEGHGHGYHIATLNIIGDGIHNFIDGLVIAGAFMVNSALGIAATISVIFHEVPQEIADFGVLLYSGMSKKKALLFNFISAATAIIGVLVAFLIADIVSGFQTFIIPFAAGNFLYIGATNLLPELHRHCGVKDSIFHILALMLGFGLMVLLVIFGPVHVH